MQKYIIGVDIGGTTYSSNLFDYDLNSIKNTDKGLIEKFSSTNELLDGISNQINSLINECQAEDVVGIGVSCPGPLESKKGVVLDTPNLSLLKNVKLKKELEKRCGIPVLIDNDANLFALGEWFLNGQKNDVFGAVTLGTGLGFGIIINGNIFHGAHGLAAEYAISPIESGNWENKVSIKAIKEMAKKYMQKPDNLEPKDIFEKACRGNSDAINTWKEFGTNLGLALSHFINMIDPHEISIGGGISNAYKFFNEEMKNTVYIHCPAYKNFDINIFESKTKEFSAQIGAALLIKKYREIL